MTTGIAQSERADFFVHPDYHRLSGAVVYDSVVEYEEALRRQIDASVMPVLIYNNDGAAPSGDFWSRFDDSHRFASKLDYGFIDPRHDQIVRLNDLLGTNGISEGVVHGSYFKLCVAGFMSALSPCSPDRPLHYNQSAEARVSGSQIPEVAQGHVLYNNARNDDSAFPYGDQFAQDSRIYHTNGRPSRGKREIYSVSGG